ncbi:camp-regulated phosphoprotein/endosulfine conserved region-domain-containing protein [Biscogniauxia mediterranea]|nr:camp-regulated phosphoprotein/endosulfine conserved region-domain-containing protein [Biscogniauxia mediterranea]
MNPHQQNKIDVNSLSPEEQRLFRLYKKLPSRSDHFAKHLKERKYFDSGDYAMSKAGKGNSVDTGSVGSQHPVPENIPHLSSPNQGINGAPGHHHHPSVSQPVTQHSPQQQSTTPGTTPGTTTGTTPSTTTGSPVKEGSFLNRGTSAEDNAAAATEKENLPVDGSGGDASKDIPIRR